MHQLIERAGEAPFPPDVQRALCREATDEMVEIKPNGAIYVPHTIYRAALDRAFGVGGWALVPLEPPRIKGDRAIWYGFLKARGQYLESAYGGCTYVARNRDMNEDDAVEGAKSDCLVRCCKALPLFRNLWQKDFSDYWRATYATQVENPTYPGKRIWKKKDPALAGSENRPGRGPQSEGRQPPSAFADAPAPPEVRAPEGGEARRLTHQDVYTDASDEDFADDNREYEEGDGHDDF